MKVFEKNLFYYGQINIRVCQNVINQTLISSIVKDIRHPHESDVVGFTAFEDTRKYMVKEKTPF